MDLVLLTFAFSFGLGMTVQKAVELVRAAGAGLSLIQAVGKLNACLFLAYLTIRTASELKNRLSRYF